MRLPLSRQLIDQLIGVEMLVATKHLLYQESPLLGFSQTSTEEVLLESFNGSLGDLNRFKRSVGIAY
jgi:hypothetical protein